MNLKTILSFVLAIIVVYIIIFIAIKYKLSPVKLFSLAVVILAIVLIINKLIFLSSISSNPFKLI